MPKLAAGPLVEGGQKAGGNFARPGEPPQHDDPILPKQHSAKRRPAVGLCGADPAEPTLAAVLHLMHRKQTVAAKCGDHLPVGRRAGGRPALLRPGPAAGWFGFLGPGGHRVQRLFPAEFARHQVQLQKFQLGTLLRGQEHGPVPNHRGGNARGHRYLPGHATGGAPNQRGRPARHLAVVLGTAPMGPPGYRSLLARPRRTGRRLGINRPRHQTTGQQSQRCSPRAATTGPVVALPRGALSFWPVFPKQSTHHAAVLSLRGKSQPGK